MAKTLVVMTVDHANTKQAEEGSEQIAAGPLRLKSH